MPHDRKMLALALFITAFGAGLLSGCKDSGTGPTETPPAAGPVSFKNDVRPLFLQYGCEGCHGGTNGLWVSSVDSLKKGGVHGAAIVPGNSEGSLLVKKISPSPPFGSRMPLNATPMSDAAQNVIKKWIDEGAKDN